MKECDKNPKKQTKEEEIAYLKNIQSNDSKNDPKSLTMELQINRLETKTEKMQQMFTEDLEYLKNKQIEMKNILEGINTRITETEKHINDLEDRMAEITATEQNIEKRMKRNEDSLRDLWDNIKYTNICIIGVPEREERERT